MNDELLDQILEAIFTGVHTCDPELLQETLRLVYLHGQIAGVRKALHAQDEGVTEV